MINSLPTKFLILQIEFASDENMIKHHVSLFLSMRGFLPLLNDLLDAANLLKYVQHVRRYFCA
jgi:hypothetical protein